MSAARATCCSPTRTNYRSIREDLNGDFPTPPGLFEIGEFGGWDRVSSELFDPQDSVLADLFRDLGVATG